MTLENVIAFNYSNTTELILATQVVKTENTQCLSAIVASKTKLIFHNYFEFIMFKQASARGIV